MRLSAGLPRKRPPAPEGRHRQQAQASTSWRPTTGSCGGVGLEGIRRRGLPQTPQTGRPERSPRHRGRRRAGRRSASLCVEAPRCGARCSTGSRSCSGERPDGERGRNSRSGSVGRPVLVGGQPVRLYVRQAGPTSGRPPSRTLERESPRGASRGPLPARSQCREENAGRNSGCDLSRLAD